MSLKFLDQIHRTLGFRLTLWYSTIFILSALVLFILSYLLLSSSIQENRDKIQAKLREYRSLYQGAGLDAVKKRVNVPQRASRRTAFFVRVADLQNKTLFLNSPHLWEKFDLKQIQSRSGEWLYLPSTRDGEVLEILSAGLSDGHTLQVGKSKEDREEILEDFRATFAGIIIPLVLVGFSGGAFLAFRALQPIHNLVQVTQAIVNTAKMDARVPMGHTRDEVDELVSLFNKMLQRIDDLIKGMREALDNVAHDLRTPMTRLRGIAEMGLQAERASDLCREALADCLEESERALTVLNTLMDISEAETGTLKLKLERIEVRPLIKGVVELYEYVAEDKGVAVSMSCPEDLVLIADRVRLQQVVANLLDNAVKYTPPGGRVDIQACTNLREVVLKVKDSGAGIGPEEISKIWDRLYRGDKSRSQRGLGLGLSLVKAVVEAHGACVEVSSEAGAGSLFTVNFPIADPQVR